jgi:hypothetical protein
MLVKYIGKVFEPTGGSAGLGTYEVRTTCLNNGLFRFTQPNYLNDNGSEFRLYPYFNEISPLDRKYGIKKFRQDNWQANPKDPSDESIKVKLGIHLKDNRYDPAVWQGLNGIPIAEFDNNSWVEQTERINHELVENISNVLGIFSLSKNPLNEHMWVMYATEGQGIAIEFDEEHPFFKQHLPEPVSYLKEDRATYTYFEGVELICGMKLKNLTLEKLDIKDMNILTNHLSLTKKSSWSQEEEMRIIMKLDEADSHIRPDISLKKIPFGAFKNIILGYNVDKLLEDKIDQIRLKNSELSHVKIKRVKHNHLGELEFDSSYS